MYYVCSRHSALDIKWTGFFNAQASSFRRHHANPHYQLIVVMDAPVRIAVNGIRYTLKTGESLLLMPWEQHIGWKHDEPQGAFYWAQFSCNPPMMPFDSERPFDLSTVYAEKTELRTAPPAAHEDMLIIPKQHLMRQRFQLLYIFEQLIAESNPPKGYFRYRESLLLGQLIQLIASDFLEQNNENTAFPTSYITYRNLVDYLHNNYSGQVIKEPIEQVMDRKYEYLSSVFKKYAGTTIVKYIHQLRVQRAKHLLLSTDLSVGEIAEEVGFQDAFYFSRVFKRIENISPQQYRNKATDTTPAVE